jgi:hypothetical protein
MLNFRILLFFLQILQRGRGGFPRDYTKGDVSDALKALNDDSEASLRTISDRFEILRSTLKRRRLKQRTRSQLY